MNHNEFERWRIDRRFFYVWFSIWPHAFGTVHTGAHLAVMDDFGSLVLTDW